MRAVYIYTVLNKSIDSRHAQEWDYVGMFIHKTHTWDAQSQYIYTYYIFIYSIHRQNLIHRTVYLHLAWTFFGNLIILAMAAQILNDMHTRQSELSSTCTSSKQVHLRKHKDPKQSKNPPKSQTPIAHTLVTTGWNAIPKDNSPIALETELHPSNCLPN